MQINFKNGSSLNFTAADYQSFRSIWDYLEMTVEIPCEVISSKIHSKAERKKTNERYDKHPNKEGVLLHNRF